MSTAQKINTKNKKTDNEEMKDNREKVVETKEEDKVEEKIDYKKKSEELEDKLLRTMAEMQNLRSRTTKQIHNEREFAITGFSRELTAVADHLLLASTSVKDDELKENALAKKTLEGVKLTYQELISVFKKNNIERIAPEQGDKFDHNLHEAVSEIEDPNTEGGKIVDIVRSGWKIKERVLRPATVVVAKK